MKNKAWLILCIIAVVAAIALSATNLITKDRIAEQEAISANFARTFAMPGAASFTQEELAEGAALDNLFSAKDDADQFVGYLGQITVTGFGGPIKVVLGVDQSSTITGISVGGSDFAETAGLGDETRKPAFTDQFIGLTAAPALGENIDGVSGATISSSAVTGGAKQIYNYAVALLSGGEAPVAEVAASITASDRREVSAMGKTEPFGVSVGVNADGSIEAVELNGDGLEMDSAFFAMANTPEYLNQFVGKSAPLAYGDGLDAVSGATITSEAVLAAVNEALGVVAEATEAPTEAPVIEGENGEKLYTNTVKGFGGEIVVTVGVDAAGTVTSLKIGGPNFNETEGFGANVKTNAFRNQFIGKVGPFAYGDGIDGISGATTTSKAVLKGINAAFEAENGADATAAPAAEATVEPTEAPTAEPTKAPTEAPTAEATKAAAPAAATSAPVAAASVAAGKYVKTAEGYGGEIEVTVKIDDAGKIESLMIGGASFNETPGYGAKAKTSAFRSQFVGKSGPFVYGEGVDAISGATKTSTAVLDAINSVFVAE